jgi:hypothetical protein
MIYNVHHSIIKDGQHFLPALFMFCGLCKTVLKAGTFHGLDKVNEARQPTLGNW